MCLFPTLLWGDQWATFLPVEISPPTSSPVFAALVFAFEGDQYVVADIVGRGWCIPGGRAEPGETPEQTARREAYEEAGLTLGPLRLIGRYLLRPLTGGDEQIVPTYTAPVLAREAIALGNDSRGVDLLRREELPTRYFRWDPLLAAVCEHAWRLRSETTLSPGHSGFPPDL